MYDKRPKKLSNVLALSSLVAYAAALVLPAIHEGGYYDSQFGPIEPHTISGLACVVGLCFSAWFVGLHFFYLLANIVFVLLTPLLFKRDADLWLIRWLLMLMFTVAPMQMIVSSFPRAMIGAYFWLLAFILSSIAHSVCFISSTKPSQAHSRRTQPLSAG